MKLQFFNGGLNTRMAEHLLKVNEGTLYSNIDNESGELKPVKDEAISGITMDEYAYFFVAKDQWVSAANDRDYVEYQNRLYYSIPNGVPKSFDGTNEYDLGILRPSTALAIDSVIAGALVGTYTYTYTFYSSSTGIESAQAPLSAEITTSFNTVNLDTIAISSDPQVDKKRIYRIGGTITTLTLVGTIDNSIVTYTDNTIDTDLIGTLLTSEDNEQALLGLKYLTEYEGMLFGILGDLLYFTPIGKPYAWPSENFIELYTTGVGIGKVSNGLIVFTGEQSFIILGKTPETLSKYPLSGDQGCKSHKSIKEVSTGLIWISNDGICSSTGGPVKVISKDKLGKINLDIINTVLHDEVYYVQLINGSILAADFRYEGAKIFKNLNLSNTNLVVGQDILYGYFNGVYKELFTGSNNKDLIFKSPVYLDGSFTERKNYKSIYIRSEGSLEVTLFFDDKEILKQSLDSNDTHDIDVPQSIKNAYSFQFNITGTGTVKEIFWGPRGSTHAN